MEQQGQQVPWLESLKKEDYLSCQTQHAMNCKCNVADVHVCYQAQKIDACMIVFI